VQEGYGEAVAERLFIFLQMEFPWALGPPDGRYLLRGGAEAEAERVLVFGTLSAAGHHGAAQGGGLASALGGGGRRRALRKTTPEPAAVAIARVTIVDPVSLSAEQQARAWLSDLDADREVRAAFAVLNRVLYCHRIASADPYLHEVSPAQALIIRAGWGEGEQVADGQWRHAQELLWTAIERGAPGSRRRAAGRRSAALRPQERLAELLGARGVTLLCEELALRARLDLEQARLSHAAVELDRAYAAALVELGEEQREDLAIRIAELEKLRDGVLEQARLAMPGVEGEPEEEIVRYALERLEAALRARTARGFTLR